MPLHPPFTVALTWPTPNYVNPVTRGYSRMIVAVIFTPLILLVLALRYYTRLSLTRKFNANDILIAATTVRTLRFASRLVFLFTL